MVSREFKLRFKKKGCDCPYCLGRLNCKNIYDMDSNVIRHANDDEVQVACGLYDENYKHLSGQTFKPGCLAHLKKGSNGVVPQINSITGVNCKGCNQYNEYAEPNRPDGSYVCFECR